MLSYKKWYLTILFIIILIVIYIVTLESWHKRISQFKPGLSEINMSESQDALDKKVKQKKSPEESDSFSGQVKLLNAPWNRDPFNIEFLRSDSDPKSAFTNRGLHTTDGRLLDLQLTGIVFFDNHYMALINNTGVREGDTVKGFKVLKIKRDYIVLMDRSGDYYTISLK